jgi:hypothetical protein
MASENAFSLDGKFLTDKKSKLLNSAPCGVVRQSQFLTIFSPKFSYIALKRFSEGQHLGLWQNFRVFLQRHLLICSNLL